MGNFNVTLQYGDQCNGYPGKWIFTELFFFYKKRQTITYEFRRDPVPSIHKCRYHRSSKGRYKHLVMGCKVKIIYPMNYDTDEDIVFTDRIHWCKSSWFNIGMIKDYDQHRDDYRTHMSWKSKKKRKQWM